jgi:protein-disulfide isomerase
MGHPVSALRGTLLVLCWTCGAAWGEQPTPQAREMRQLQEEVHHLEAQQQQILDGLDELKKLVRGGGVGPPGVKAPEKVSVAGESFRGDAGASLAIIEYADFECPFCRRFEHDTLPQIRDAYIKTGKVKYFYRDFPLAFHEHSMSAAQVARCAAEQGKFWEMHDSLFEEPAALGTADVERRAGTLGLDLGRLEACVSGGRPSGMIQKSVSEATQMQINGTPTFLIGTIAPNGDIVNVRETLVGAYPFEAFKAKIEPLLSGKASGG